MASRETKEAEQYAYLHTTNLFLVLQWYLFCSLTRVLKKCFDFHVYTHFPENEYVTLLREDLNNDFRQNFIAHKIANNYRVNGGWAKESEIGKCAPYIRQQIIRTYKIILLARNRLIKIIGKPKATVKYPLESVHCLSFLNIIILLVIIVFVFYYMPSFVLYRYFV